MRLLQTTGRLAALAVLLPLALAGCDAAGPDPALATADARPDAGFTTGRMSGDGPAVRGRQDKVAVCHSDDDGTFRLIEVGAPALPAHIRHGDGVPGGAVPGQEGFVFDSACAPVPVEFAACFTGNGLGFNLTISSLTGSITGTVEPRAIIFDISGDVTDPSGSVASVGAVDAFELRATIRTPTPGIIPFADVEVTRQGDGSFSGTISGGGATQVITGTLTEGPCVAAAAAARASDPPSEWLRGE